MLNDDGIILTGVWQNVIVFFLFMFLNVVQITYTIDW